MTTTALFDGCHGELHLTLAHVHSHQPDRAEAQAVEVQAAVQCSSCFLSLPIASKATTQSCQEAGHGEHQVPTFQLRALFPWIVDNVDCNLIQYLRVVMQ